MDRRRAVELDACDDPSTTLAECNIADLTVEVKRVFVKSLLQAAYRRNQTVNQTLIATSAAPIAAKAHRGPTSSEATPTANVASCAAFICMATRLMTRPR